MRRPKNGRFATKLLPRPEIEPAGSPLSGWNKPPGTESDEELPVAAIFKRGKHGIWWIKYRVAGKQVYHSLHTTNARAASNHNGLDRQALRIDERSATFAGVGHHCPSNSRMLEMRPIITRRRGSKPGPGQVRNVGKRELESAAQ
jgi:hypothetical protein